MTERTVQHVRVNRIGLEKYILEALNKFEEMNDVSISNISITKASQGGVEKYVESVEIDIDIRRY